MKKIKALIISFSLIAVLTFSSCLNGETKTTPIVISGADRSIFLDLNDEISKVVTLSEYIDENGVNNITYDVAVSYGNAAIVSEVSNGKFTVTAVCVGHATVLLKVLQDNEEKISMSFNVSVIDTKPAEPIKGQFYKSGWEPDIVTYVSDELTSYTRMVEFGDGTLLATGEGAGMDNGIVIMRSIDRGDSFSKAANVHDPNRVATGINQKNAQWQPDLYILPRDVGNGTILQKGDVLLVAVTINGNGVMPNSSNKITETIINLYASKDKGLTWNFISEIARSRVDWAPGTPGVPQEKQFGLVWPREQNGIWEPNIIVNDDGVLICYYADETAHAINSQRIVYRSTTDGLNWGDITNVTAVSPQNLRPGMPVVTRIKDGQYFIVYEMVGETGNPIYWKKSSDGLNWGDYNAAGTRIEATDALGTVRPHSTPYVVWTPSGKDEHGTIFVTAMRTHWSPERPSGHPSNDLFASYNSGATWIRIDNPLSYTWSEPPRQGYSNSLAFSKDGRGLYVLNTLPIGNRSNNTFIFTRFSLEYVMTSTI